MPSFTIDRGEGLSRQLRCCDAASWAGSGSRDREGGDTGSLHAAADKRVNSSVTENIFSFKKIWKKKSNHLIMHLECGYRNMRALFL